MELDHLILTVNDLDASIHFFTDVLGLGYEGTSDPFTVIRVSDELWVFGTTIANGVLFEIAYAHELGMPVKLFSIGNRATEIVPVPIERLRTPDTRPFGIFVEEAKDE